MSGLDLLPLPGTGPVRAEPSQCGAGPAGSAPLQREAPDGKATFRGRSRGGRKGRLITQKATQQDTRGNPIRRATGAKHGGAATCASSILHEHHDSVPAALLPILLPASGLEQQWRTVQVLGSSAAPALTIVKQCTEKLFLLPSLILPLK